MINLAFLIQADITFKSVVPSTIRFTFRAEGASSYISIAPLPRAHQKIMFALRSYRVNFFELLGRGGDRVSRAIETAAPPGGDRSTQSRVIE